MYGLHSGASYTRPHFGSTWAFSVGYGVHVGLDLEVCRGCQGALRGVDGVLRGDIFVPETAQVELKSGLV